MEVIFGVIFIPVLTVYFLTPYYIKRLKRKEKASTLNFEGKRVVTAGGMVILAALVFSFIFLYYIPHGSFFYHESFSWAALIYLGGITILGAADDLWGEKECKGFRGHLHKLYMREGISTGIYKAAGGILLGIVLSAFIVGGYAWHEWIIKGFFLALFSNFFNLLDTRPTRTAKVFFVLSLLFMLFKGPFLILFSLWSALYVYLFWETKRHIMLGDAGAYLLGGALGYFFILILPLESLIVPGFLLIFLHWYFEKFSLNRLLEEKVFLNWLNRTNGRG